MSDLSDPAELMLRLEAIERDLAERMIPYGRATARHYELVREQKRAEALAIVSSDKGTVTERKASGTLAAFDEDKLAAEGEYEALKAVVSVLDKRGMILMSLLKAHGRN